MSSAAEVVVVVVFSLYRGCVVEEFTLSVLMSISGYCPWPICKVRIIRLLAVFITSTLAW